MDFPRIDSALENCEAHLKSIDVPEPLLVELESYLVSAMTALIVAEYEQFIETLFSRRGDLCGDNHVANFVRSQIARKFRSPDLGKLNETLGWFGQDYRTNFSRANENTPEHAAWDNIMKARHAVVHRQGTINLTLRELRVSYALTKNVLDRLVLTLGL